MRYLFLLITAGVALVPMAWANEYQVLYRGPRAQAMGGAFVAVADDDQALFYNPAGLAGIKQTSFHLLDVNVETNEKLLLNALGIVFGGASPMNLLSSTIGQQLHARATAVTSFTRPNFSVAYIYDINATVITQNVAMPRVLLMNQWTHGIQAGTGFTVLKWAKKRGQLRLGAAAKVLWRRGGLRERGFTEFLNIALTSSYLDSLTGAWSGPAFGVDAGLQAVHEFKKGIGLRAGLAFTDIGNTTFPSSLADPIQGNLSAGIAGVLQVKGIDVILSYDVRNILQSGDWRKKNHLGLQVGVPFLQLYGGINQVSYTYGFGLDLWLVKITGLSYQEELGASPWQISDRRYMLQASVKFSF